MGLIKSRENKMNRIGKVATRMTQSVRSFGTSSMMMAGSIIELESYDQFNKVIEHSPTLIIDFHAEWCGPCKMLAPILTKVIESRDGVDLLKIDVDEFDELAAHFQVRAMPTVVMVKNGEVVDQFMGLKQEPELVNFIEKNM